ncbi:polysaccharide pyruvyl transferase family protein [Baaleninema sp.]|uniref:polysaccharide pyruvyl transferase family protein n=1 Tax=Baaleninema sp. TaxID=3101197 RepID=UPI003D06BEBB
MIPERAPGAQQVAFFSTGAGYNQNVNIEDNWTIYCVRGPLSACLLGLPKETAVTDGAVLVRRLFKSEGVKQYKYSFMSHFSQSITGAKTWTETCEMAGIHYIDPRQPVEEVLKQIDRTEILLTEALHGAIVADALRVPWICVHTAIERILPFKWIDWCESVGLSYRPYGLHQMRDLSPQYGIRGIRGIRGSRAAVLASLTHWLKKREVVEQFKDIKKRVEPNLSDETLLENLTVELETRLEQFKADVAAGKFA